jgi:hypothetical protein
VFSIPSPRLGDRKHTTRWIKIISHHKPWEILYITHKARISYKIHTAKILYNIDTAKILYNKDAAKIPYEIHLARYRIKYMQQDCV